MNQLNQVTILLTIAQMVSCRHSDMAVGYTPPSVLVGTAEGFIERCRSDDINRCSRRHTLDAPVTSLAVLGEFVYATAGNTLHRCHLHEENKCTKFHKSDSRANTLTIAGTKVFVGTKAGVIHHCGVRKSDNCEVFYETVNGIHALTSVGEFLYVGSESMLLSCPLDESDMCTELINATSRINTLNYDSKFIYAGLKDGTVMRCQLESDNCSTLHKAHSEIIDIDILGDNLQIALPSGEIIRYDMGKNESLTFDKKDGSILSLASIYGTGRLSHHYTGESYNCTWQFGDCPPYVNYFDVESREALRLHVKDGLLINSRGEPFDTNEADWCHTGRRAIFVMDPVGNVYASNKHPILLLHHSSLLAGNPTAAAGELSVIQGHLKVATSCSGHYRQSIELTKQLVSALKRQGYDAPFDFRDCRRMRLFIDMYYNKLDLYYETKYGKNYVRPISELEQEQFFI